MVVCVQGERPAAESQQPRHHQHRAPTCRKGSAQTLQSTDAGKDWILDYIQLGVWLFVCFKWDIGFFFFMDSVSGNCKHILPSWWFASVLVYCWFLPVSALAVINLDVVCSASQWSSAFTLVLLFFFFSSYGSTADLVLCILQPLLLEAHGIQLTLLVSHEHEQTCMGGKSVVYVIVSVRPAREIL